MSVRKSLHAAICSTVTPALLLGGVIFVVTLWLLLPLSEEIAYLLLSALDPAVAPATVPGK